MGLVKKPTRFSVTLTPNRIHGWGISCLPLTNLYAINAKLSNKPTDSKPKINFYL